MSITDTGITDRGDRRVATGMGRTEKRGVEIFPSRESDLNPAGEQTTIDV
ncbi:MAG: hypothetical protein WEB58_05655 [Planctomycetaceae bacterium]